MADEDREIDIRELAQILGVSAPTAAALLARGELPSWLTPSGERRVRRADALAYQAIREQRRRSLRELAAMAQRDEGDGPSRPSSSVHEDPEDETGL